MLDFFLMKLCFQATSVKSKDRAPDRKDDWREVPDLWDPLS